MDAETEVSAAPWTRARLQEQGVSLRVVNVLAHGCFRQEVDIKRLALLVRNASYSPKGFSALTLRFRAPRATLLVYRSGKFLVIGATSAEIARAALDKFLAILKKVDCPREVRDFEIANVVGSADVGFKVRLEGLARMHSRFCTYEPELFPGLIYRMLQPKCTLLVFVSGKIVITGCKHSSEHNEALGKIFPVLLQLRLRVRSSSSSGDSSTESEDEAATDDAPW